MIETLFGIRYTGSVKIAGTPVVYGYTLDGKGTATVFRITPTGDVPLGTTPVAFPHKDSVSAYVERVM
jgi:hypothetical protein